MTDAEKVEVLRSAIERADRKLEWILGDTRHSEWMLTTAKHVRNILRAAMKRTEDKSSTETVSSASRADIPKVKLGRRALQFMRQDGILKEAKRK